MLPPGSCTCEHLRNLSESAASHCAAVTIDTTRPTGAIKAAARTQAAVIAAIMAEWVGCTFQGQILPGQCELILLFAAGDDYDDN
jgi:hypothetical protein